jgi:hypothetical protein
MVKGIPGMRTEYHVETRKPISSESKVQVGEDPAPFLARCLHFRSMTQGACDRDAPQLAYMLIGWASLRTQRFLESVSMRHQA